MIAFRPQENPLIALKISDMTCGRSVGAVANAVKNADRGAKVRIDMTTHRVEIEPSRASVSELVEAITKAGYRPVLIEDSALTAFPWSESCSRAFAGAMTAFAVTVSVPTRTRRRTPARTSPSDTPASS